MDIEYIKETAKKMTSNSNGSHDWYHTKRVYDLCMKIGKAEGANLDALGIAAYLHDIGRPFQDMAKGKICHAEKGAELATEIPDRSPASSPQKEASALDKSMSFEIDALIGL